MLIYFTRVPSENMYLYVCLCVHVRERERAILAELSYGKNANSKTLCWIQTARSEI